MLRIPPPDIAMRLADEHRHDLLAAAGKQPATSDGLRPLSNVAALVAGLALRAAKKQWRANRARATAIYRKTRFGPSSEAQALPR